MHNPFRSPTGLMVRPSSVPTDASNEVRVAGSAKRRQREPAQPSGGFGAALSMFLQRRRWIVLSAWALMLAVAGVSAGSLSDVLSGGGWYVTGSASQEAATRLADARLLGRGATAVTLVIHDRHYTANDPRFLARAQQVVSALAAQKALHVGSVIGYTTLSAGARDHYVGRDQRTAIDSVALGLDDGAARRELPAAQAVLTDTFGRQGVTVSLVSPAAMWGAVNIASQQDLLRAELFTLPLIMVILLMIYRSVTAAIVSLAVGVTAIIFTLGVLSPIAHHVEMSVFIENAATMLGLGVGVDYSLFIISRYTEELRRGRTASEAVAESLRTSGHTVVLSGATIIATMAALLLIRLNVIVSIAVGAITVVAFSILAATLLLPSLLHVLGSRIFAGQFARRHRQPVPAGASRDDRHAESNRWHQLAMAVMRRPVTVIILCVAALGLLALPAGQIRTFSPDARILPTSSPARQGYDYVQRDFGVGASSPIQVVIHSTTPLDTAAAVSTLTALQTKLSQLPGVASVQSALTIASAANPATIPTAILASRNQMPHDLRDQLQHYISANGETTVIELLPAHQAADTVTQHLVQQVRELTAGVPAPLNVVVGGETAEGMDANKLIQAGLLKVVLAMLALVYLVLLLTFRSVLLPLKAVAMNVLSLAATYGVLVSVFQKGIGTGVLGLDHTGSLQNFVPVLLLALLFSLSTDYEVFLLSRIRENYLRTDDNIRSVASGLESTAPLISGAAALMVAVFGAFAFTGMVPIEQLGFGMAVAIFLDATIVRALLVPATMRLLGRWNWWLPFRPRAATPR